MIETPKGKGKKQDFIETREQKPVSHDPDFHIVRVEHKVELRTGNIHATYICEDCPLRMVRVHPPIEGFSHHVQEGKI